VGQHTAIDEKHRVFLCVFFGFVRDAREAEGKDRKLAAPQSLSSVWSHHHRQNVTSGDQGYRAPHFEWHMTRETRLHGSSLLLVNASG
jgi:hypothetical protein